MDGEKCIFCSAYIPEGRQICHICENTLLKYKDVVKATVEQTPAEYKGNKYGCISAFIIRSRGASRVKFKKRYIAQVELMSGRANSVIIADPNEVTILKEWRPANEQNDKKRD